MRRLVSCAVLVVGCGASHPLPPGAFDAATTRPDASRTDVDGGSERPDTLAPGVDADLIDAARSDAGVIDAARSDAADSRLDAGDDGALGPTPPLRGWAPLPTPVLGEATITWLAEAPGDGTLMLAGTTALPAPPHGLYRSTDGGATWTRVHTTVGLFQAVFAPSDPSTAYAFDSAGGLARSDDAGVTWVSIAAPTGLLVTAPTIDPRDRDRLYVARELDNHDLVVSSSYDGGVTWNATTPLLSLSDSASQHSAQCSVDVVVLADGSVQFVVAVTVSDGGTAVYSSSDGGRTWSTLEQRSGALSGGRFFKRAPSDPNTWYLVADQICRSRDAGVHWSCADSLPSGGRMVLQIYDIVGIDAADPDVVYLTANGDLFRSEDGGVSWQALLALDGSHLVRSAALGSAAVAGRLFFGTDGLVRSADRGATFEAAAGFDVAPVTYLAVARDDDRTIFIQQSNWTFVQLYASDDAGWFLSLSADSSPPYLASSGGSADSSPPYVTRSGGLAWRALGPFGNAATMADAGPGLTDLPAHFADEHFLAGVGVPGRPLSLFLPDATVETVQSSGAVAMDLPTTDGIPPRPMFTEPPQQPEPLVPDWPHGCAIDPGAPDVRVCCTIQNLVLSSDGGQHWTTALGSGCTQAYVPASASGVIYARAPGHFWRTTDGGAHFQDVVPADACAESPCSAEANGENLVDNVLVDRTDPQHVVVQVTPPRSAAADTHEEQTFDGGEHWSPLPVELSHRHLLLDPVNPRISYSYGVGGVRKSRDDGSTWTTVNEGLDGLDVCGLVPSQKTSGVLFALTCAGSEVPDRVYWTATGGE